MGKLNGVPNFATGAELQPHDIIKVPLLSDAGIIETVAHFYGLGHSIPEIASPNEVRDYCGNAGLEVREMSGIRPVFSSLRWSSFFTGIVPLSLRFKLSTSLALSYIGFAIKV